MSIMIKKITNYFVLPVTIFIMVFAVLFPKTTVDMTNFTTEGLELNYTVSTDIESKDIAMLSEKEKKENQFNAHDQFYPYLGKSYLGFKEALAYKESRGNYYIVNELGYLGKYQFGVATLQVLGIYNPDKFLYNTELQEKAFLAYMQRSKWVLRHEISKYVGKKINGVVITESGILAAAHLAGPGSVKKFLKSYGANNIEDAFGTSITYYMKKFAGYDTSFIVADKKAKANL
jgi:hypothetical protein